MVLETTLTSIDSSWTDKRFTDAEVLCDGQTWEVHRVILSTHSEYFRRVFNLKTGKDAYTAIDLNLEEEPPLIEAMLKFMYTHGIWLFLCTGLASG